MSVNGRRDALGPDQVELDELDEMLTSVRQATPWPREPFPCNPSRGDSCLRFGIARMQDIARHSFPSSINSVATAEPPAIMSESVVSVSHSVAPSANSVATGEPSEITSALISNVSFAFSPEAPGGHGNVSGLLFYGGIPPPSHYSPSEMKETSSPAGAWADVLHGITVENEGFSPVVNASKAAILAPIQAEFGPMVKADAQDVDPSGHSMVGANDTGSSVLLFVANVSDALVSAADVLALHRVPDVDAASRGPLMVQAILQNAVDDDSGPRVADNVSKPLAPSTLPQALKSRIDADDVTTRVPVEAPAEMIPFWEGAAPSAAQLDTSMDSLMAAHWQGDARAVFSEPAMLRPPSPKARVCSAAFMVTYMFAAVTFLNKGSQYVGQLGVHQIAAASSERLQPCRSIVFHGLIAFAAAALGIARGLELLECPRVFWSVPWCYFGRAVAGTLLVMTLGHASGAKDSEVCPAATLTAAAWVQLGMATAAKEQTLHWGLALSGVMCGAVALHSVNVMADRSTISTSSVGATNMQRELRCRMSTISDLATFCSISCAGLWLSAEGVHLLNGTCVVVLRNMLDMLLVVGCGHLLLKKPEFLDMACAWPSCQRNDDMRL